VATLERLSILQIIIYIWRFCYQQFTTFCMEFNSHF